MKKNNSLNNFAVRILPVNKRRGAISIFLAIVIPLIIVLGFLLYDLLYLRHRDAKALKIVYSVSEAKLSRYNEFLKKEYFIFANLESAPLDEYVDEYMKLNYYDSNTNYELMRLDEPKYFRKAIVHSSKGMIADEAIDLVKKKLGLDEFQNELVAKINRIDRAMEGIANLISLPSQVRELKTTTNVYKIQTLIYGSRKAINKDSEKFGKLSSRIYKDAEGIENEELSQSKTEDIEKIRKGFEDRNKQVTVYLDEAERLLKIVRKQEEEVEKIEDRISDKKGDIYDIKVEMGNSELTEELIQAYMERIEKIESDIEELESQLEEEEEKLDQLKEDLHTYLEEEAPPDVDKSGYDRFMEGVKKGMSSLLSLFEATSTEAKVLLVLNDFTSKPYGLESGIGDKILINEWCMNVFSSYDKHCEIEKRPIKGELEYLVSGLPSEVASLSMVKLEIAGLRIPPNFVTFFGTKARQHVDDLLVVIPAPYQYIAKALVYTALVGGESYLDVERMLKGEKIRFVKRTDEWRLSIEALKNEGFHSLMTADGGEDSWDKLSYEDYLRILLFIQAEENTVLRAMNVIDATVAVQSDNQFFLSDFSIGHIIDTEYENKSLVSVRHSKIHWVNSYD